MSIHIGAADRLRALYKVAHEEAFQMIHMGIDLEQLGQVDRALHCYEMGIRAARQALSLSISSLPEKYDLVIALNWKL